MRVVISKIAMHNALRSVTRTERARINTIDTCQINRILSFQNNKETKSITTDTLGYTAVAKLVVNELEVDIITVHYNSHDWPNFARLFATRISCLKLEGETT